MPIKAEYITEFESKMTKDNKNTLEKILDSIDSCSCYSGDKAYSALRTLLGDKPAYVIRYVLDLYGVNEIEKIQDISVETRNYLISLYARYAFKLRGVLSRRLLERPNEWIMLDRISTSYDSDSEEVLMKIAIYKTNKECLVIEDTFANLFTLATYFLRHVSQSAELEKHIDSVYIGSDEIETARKYIDDLNAKLSKKKH